MIGVSHMIIRKFVSAIMVCILVMLSSSLAGETAFAFFLGMYLMPILLFYGVPSSILSDFVTKKLNGFFRASIALFIHLFLATFFVLIPILFSERDRNLLLTDIGSLFDNFFFIVSLLSSFLFYCLDEFLRSKLAKYLHQKILLSKRAQALCKKFGDMRI